VLGGLPRMPRCDVPRHDYRFRKYACGDTLECLLLVCLNVVMPAPGGACCGLPQRNVGSAPARAGVKAGLSWKARFQEDVHTYDKSLR